MNRDNNEYLVLGNDGLIDISSGSPVSAGYGDEKQYSSRTERRNKTKLNKKIIIIASAAVVAVALGVAGFIVFKSFNGGAEQNAGAEFSFTDRTVVSGVDITGTNMAQAKKLLELNKKKFINPVSFNIDINGENVELNQDDFSYTFDIDEVLAKAMSEAENGEKLRGDETRTYTVTATVTEESVNKNVGKICDDADTKPENAYVSEFHPYAEKRFDFVEAIDGCKVNSQDLKKQFSAAFAEGNSMYKLIADVETEDAEFDAEALEKSLVKLASYETYSTNTANGTNNMKVSLAACNGSIIEPGETWSFNDCTGDSNLAENGYKSAHVISDGKLTDGIGGGICQSSSTIYNAAVRANLKIEERYNHKWASAYVPTGFDATIDYPNLDLKLSNPTEHQIFLECKVVDSTLYATFWGVKTGDYDEIRTHNEISETGKSSYSVRAWRVYFKDGKEIDREELSKSTYDKDYGVVFIEADNDNKSVDRDVDDLDDTTSKAESSQAEISKPAESSDSSKPTSKPASKPTEPSVSETEAQPIVTEPSEDGQTTTDASE